MRPSDRGPGTGALPGDDERARRPPRTAEPSVHRLYAHLAWGTLDRLPLAGPRTALLLESELISLCRRLDVEPVEVAVEADRVHVLVRHKPNQALGELVRRLKQGSSDAARRRAAALRWGRGWAAATVSPGDVRELKRRLAGRSGGLDRLTSGLEAT